MSDERIPAAAFLRALPELEREGFQAVGRMVAAQTGEKPQSIERGLRRMADGEQATVGFDLADRILTALGRPEAMLELAPLDTVLEVGLGWCKHCRTRQPEEPGETCPDCGHVLVRRGGWRRPDRHRFSEDEVRTIYRLHMDLGFSLREIARRLYERMGYASPSSCLETLRQNLRYQGLMPRRPGQATAVANIARRQRPAWETKSAYKRRMRRERGYRDSRTGEWRVAGKEK